jgi:lipopolysaccharide/colanic/teichoic acid biosynthesis glycosyltransferase
LGQDVIPVHNFNNSSTKMSTARLSLPWKTLAAKKAAKAVAKASLLHGLNPPEKTRAIIERERTRSDRTATGFSLLVISASGGRRGKATLVRVANHLRTRIRLTDEIGWLDDHQLCLVLSATLPAGAWNVADSVRKEFADEIGLEYKVYYYPSDEHFDVDCESDSTDDGQPVPASAQPMEPLFAQPVLGWKRCLDVVGAVIALVLLSPILILAAITIRLTSPGPIFFGQQRSGRGGAPFVMYKFRSMVADAEQMKHELLARNEQDGPAFKIRSDPRVTPIGRFLRRTSIDELPQLWNVVRGEMSLVGPRPLPCDETANCRSWHRRRVDVMPGMTCIWQLHGRSKVTFDEWVRMDICYIRKLSLVSDVKLIMGTLPVLLWRTSGC